MRITFRQILPFAALSLLPLLEAVLPTAYHISGPVRTIFILSLLGFGLNIVTGYTGLLNLGCAAFMAIGAYSYAVLTSSIFPFQIGFWWGIAASCVIGLLSGALLGLPAIRLRGDYLAIVTLGFGEIIQDLLRNLDYITKGTQGINPLPYPSFGTLTIDSTRPMAWYYFLLIIIFAMYLLSSFIEHSKLGRRLQAVREDELAARSIGIPVAKTKLCAFSLSSGLCAMSGALWVTYFSSTGEPGNYDFNISVMALCMVIVGGLGQLNGVLLGAFLIIGTNSIVLAKLGAILASYGLTSTTNVYSSPTNWKYLLFGLALVLVMKFRPQGLVTLTEHSRSKVPNA